MDSWQRSRFFVGVRQSVFCVDSLRSKRAEDATAAGNSATINVMTTASETVDVTKRGNNPKA